MIFDLDTKFHSLVNQYFEDYSSMSATEFGVTINEFIKSTVGQSSFAIYGVGRVAKGLVFALDDETKSRIVCCGDKAAQSQALSFEGMQVLSPKQLFEASPDYVILCSFDLSQAMKETLIEVGFDETQLFPLDHSIAEAVLYERTSGYVRTSAALMSYAALDFCNDPAIAADVIKEVIYSYIEIRDIVNVRRYTEQYVQRNCPNAAHFKAFVHDLDLLLTEVRTTIQNRQSQLLTIYVLDGLSEKMIELSPYLTQQKKNSLVFDRAFTQYGRTTSSLQCMFTGKDLVDEGSCEIKPLSLENASLLRTMKDFGYKFKPIICNSQNFFDIKDFDVQQYPVMPLQMWHFLCDLCATDEAQVSYIHTLETHSPYRNGFTPIPEYYSQFDLNDGERFDLLSYRQLEVMRTMRYVDEQMAFYDDFLSDQTTTVYMSDHSNVFNNYVSPESDYFSIADKIAQVTRLSLFVSGPTVQPMTTTEIFSMKYFSELFLYLIGKKSIEEVTCEYAKLQILPHYNILLLEHFGTRQPLPQRGVIIDSGVYLIDYDGKEVFWPFTLDDHIDDPAYADEVAKCRTLCGNDFHNIFDMQKFTLAKKYYVNAGLINPDGSSRNPAMHSHTGDK